MTSSSSSRTWRTFRSGTTRSWRHGRRRTGPCALEVTKLEPDRIFAVHGGLGPFEATLTYEFEDVAGMTRLTNGADLEASGIMKLAAPIASSRIREAVAANLEALKQLLER